MKVVINPTYEYLREWIEQAPCFFEHEGTMLYKGRNMIKTFTFDNGLDINIKRYRKPVWFNRIVYSFFRKTKAFRAYHNTLRIAVKGFATAEAIASIETKQNGLLSDSYFISLQLHEVEEMRAYYYGPLSGNEALIDAFARYSAKLHDAGIYHLDYSPGNILIRNDNGKYLFYLIDVNRMKFEAVTVNAGCRNFARLFGDDDIYRTIGMVYSQCRKEPFSQEEAVRLIMKYKEAFLQMKSRKAKIKRLLKKS